MIISPITTILGGALSLSGIDRVLVELEPFFDLLFNGAVNLLWLVMDLEYTSWLLGIIITIETALAIFKVIMWIIKKIPFLGIT